MIAIILGIIATIILTILVRKETKNDNKDWYARSTRRLAVFLVCMFALIIDLTAFGIYTGVAVETAQTPEIVASTNLVTLRDNSSVSGSFFLGSGSVNNKNYYAFYYEAQHGYKYQALDAESYSSPVYIKYISAEETPRIDQYAVVERKALSADGDYSWLFSIIAWLSYNQYETGDIISEEITSPALFAPSDNPNYYDNWRYEIHIPEGSIKTDYTIDME